MHCIIFLIKKDGRSVWKDAVWHCSTGITSGPGEPVSEIGDRELAACVGYGRAHLCHLGPTGQCVG